MSPRTLLRLALAGSRTDTLRVVLTAISAAIATGLVLLTATVLAIPGIYDTHAGTNGGAAQYRLQVLVEPGLRPGVAIALLLLTIPVLALTAQCGRLGAPARERRLAAIRLAGATPGQAMRVAVAETGLASGLGSLLGLVSYLIGRWLLHRPDENGLLLLPTDVLPPVWVIGAICAGLPLLAMGIAMSLSRRIAFTPYGVVRRVRTGAPRPFPGLLIALGIGVAVGFQPLLRWTLLNGNQSLTWMLPAALFFGALAASLGVVLGTGWLSHATGKMLHRFGRGPVTLLAARRLIDDPWSGSRTFAVLLVCVLFGAGASGLRSGFATEFANWDDASRWITASTGTSYFQEDRSFYFDTFNLVNGVVGVAITLAAMAMLVAIAESIVSRRRAYAAMVATGVPRTVLARVVLVQALAPIVPAVMIALAVGVTLPIAVARGRVSTPAHEETICTGVCDGSGSAQMTVLRVPAFVRSIPIPWDDLALCGAGTVLAVLVATGIGLLFLRGSTALEELRTD